MNYLLRNLFKNFFNNIAKLRTVDLVSEKRTQ